MGAVPTKDRLDAITSWGLTPMHIQICCFKKHPTKILVEHGVDSGGVIIPNAEFFKLEMSNPKMRQHDFRKLRTTLVTSLRRGNNAYVHCVTGVSRAPAAACVFVSLLMNEDVVSSTKRIARLRNVQLYDKQTTNMRRDWMDKLVNEACTVHQASNSYLANTKKFALVHAAVTSQRGSDTANQPLCKWTRIGTPPAKPDNRAEIDTAEEARHFSNSFCHDCLSKVSASRRTHIKNTF